MKLDEVSRRLWANRIRRDPVSASLKGFHELDDRLADLSESALDDIAADLDGIQADAESLDDEGLTFQERITKSLAIHEAAVVSAAMRDRHLVGAVDTYIGAGSSLLVAAATLTSPSNEVSVAYMDRWSGMPVYLENAARLHLEESNRGREPAQRVVERVLNGLNGYLASPIEDDPFLKATVNPSSSPEFTETVAGLVLTVIRPAYQSYCDFIQDRILPTARPDERPGMRYMAEGDDTYRSLVGFYTTIDADPVELHEYGLADATERLPAEWAAAGESALGLSDLSDLFDRLRNDPDLSYDSEEQMLAHAEATIARAWEAVDGWFGARPGSPCAVAPVPASLAEDLPPAFYFAPAHDGSRPGIYYLNTFEPTTRKRFAYESIHFHEAVPGHHFDRSLSVELTEIPEFRRYFAAFAHVEGWGLYAERLADEMGLYTTDLDRLGMLAADAWRSGRLVVDTGLHHLGWTRQQAIDWFMQWTPIARSVIEQEVDRYIGMAGQALAYKTGQREILRLRRDSEQRLGSAFEIRGFHDAVLTSGGLTLPVLGEVVEDWVETAAS